MTECNVSLCKFSKIIKPVYCTKTDCDFVACNECYVKYGKVNCMNCNEQHTFLGIMRKNPHLPKVFQQKFLSIVSKKTLQEELREYNEQFPRMELLARREDLDAEIKRKKVDLPISKHQLIIHKLEMKNLHRLASITKCCPIEDCNGICSNGKCDSCHAHVCMKCVCLKNGKIDPKHGKNKCDPIKLLPHEEVEDETTRRVINPHIQKYRLEAEVVKRKIETIQNFHADLERLIQERTEIFRTILTGEQEQGASTSSGQSRVPVAFCPKTECNGRVFACNWKCNACHSDVCERCLEIKDAEDEHVCDEDTVRTLDFIRSGRQVKCPVCGLEVTDAGGCSQFWCSNEPGMGGCGTLFNKNTRKVLDPANTFIHNPHALEARRRQRENADILPNNNVGPNNNEGGIACQEPVSRIQIRRTMKANQVEGANNQFGSELDPAYLIADTQNIMRTARFSEDRAAQREKLRFDFFKGRITEEDWLKKLKPIAKRMIFNREIRPIFETYTETIHTISWEYVHLHFNTEDYLKQLDSLREMTVENFQTLSRFFGYSEKISFNQQFATINF